MTEAEWLACESLFLLWNHGGLMKSERKVRLHGAALCRLLWDYLDLRNRIAVEVTERYVDGDASHDKRDCACVAVSKADTLDTARTTWVHSIAASAVASLASQVFSPNRFILDACNGVERAYPGEGNRRELNIFRDIFGNPFRSVAVESSWLTSDVRTLAEGIYQDRVFDRMPILADALQDAGCANDDILSHCRNDTPHVRGCWVVDLLTGRK